MRCDVHSCCLQSALASHGGSAGPLTCSATSAAVHALCAIAAVTAAAAVTDVHAAAIATAVTVLLLLLPCRVVALQLEQAVLTSLHEAEGDLPQEQQEQLVM